MPQYMCLLQFKYPQFSALEHNHSSHCHRRRGQTLSSRLLVGGCGARPQLLAARICTASTSLALQDNSIRFVRRHYAAPGSIVHELKELAKLHAEGSLTEQEYKDAKAAVISDKKNVYFTGGDVDGQRDGSDTFREVVRPAASDSAVDESIKEKKKARSASFNKIGQQAVAMAGLADEAQGEVGLGQALAHVARDDQPQEMPGGGAGFSIQRTGRRRLDDASREQRIGAGAVLRARAAEKHVASARSEQIVEPIDQRLAAELGVSLMRDTKPDTARSGTYYLRIACRMIGVPGQAMSEVSTNTPKRLLDEAGLSYVSMTPDVAGECVVVLTPPDTSEALVLSTIAIVIKANGSPTFGPELPDPVMYRVETHDTL